MGEAASLRRAPRRSPGRGRRHRPVRVAAHLTLVPGIAELLKSEAADEVVLVVGGTIPNEDIPELKQVGWRRCSRPAPAYRGIITYIERAVRV